MDSNILDLKQERATHVASMRSILDQAEEEKRDLSGEEQQEYGRLEAEVDSLGTRVARLETQRDRERELAERELELDPRTLNGGGDDRGDEQQAAEYRQVFQDYLRFGLGELDSDQRKVLRTGYTRMTDSEQRAQAKGTGSAGGFLVPTEFEARLQEHKVQAGAIRQTRATILETGSGEDLQVPKTTVHGVAVRIGENTGVTEGDETFGQVTLQAFIYARLIKVPLGLIEDSAVDLDGYLARELGRSIGALQNSEFVTGAGTTGIPNGVITAATIGKTGTTGQTTTIIYDDVIDLIHSIGVPYRRDGEFLAADGLIKALRKLKDSTGSPLWEPSLKIGEPDALLGYRVWDDPDVATPAANAKSLAFGDFSTYWIRDVKGVAIRRLEERFADALQVGYLAWMRSDADQVDTTGSIKVYAHSAT